MFTLSLALASLICFVGLIYAIVVQDVAMGLVSTLLCWAFTRTLVRG
jgi:hypothetical protein